MNHCKCSWTAAVAAAVVAAAAVAAAVTAATACTCLLFCLQLSALLHFPEPLCKSCSVKSMGRMEYCDCMRIV